MRKRRAWRWEHWPQSRSVQQRKEEQLQQWDQSLGQPSPAPRLHTSQGGRSSWMELDRDCLLSFAHCNIPTLPTGANAPCKLQVTPKLPQPCGAHHYETPQTHLLLPQAKLLLHGGHPLPQPGTKRMPGMNWPLQSPQLFHSLPFFFFFSPSQFSYFFCFFCLGILSTPAKERGKKKLITEKSYVLCWQIAQGALSALIRLCRGAAARCCPQPPAGS